MPGGDVRVTDTKLPSLVYAEDLCGANVLDGFTQTDLLTRVRFLRFRVVMFMLTLVQFGRMVLQGPNHAMEEPTAAMQKGNAKIHDIRSVTDEFIAYCVTQVRRSTPLLPADTSLMTFRFAWPLPAKDMSKLMVCSTTSLCTQPSFPSCA